MFKIFCTVPTSKIKDLGKKLGLEPDVVNNLISVWQSISNRPNTMPTIAQLKELIKNNQKEIEAYRKAATNEETSKSIEKISSISDRTASFGVIIDPNLIRTYKRWLKNNPNGIVAYRVNKATFNTPEMVEEGIIGNPFDWQKYGEDKSLQMFYDWLTTGNNYGEEKATESFRKAIIGKILSTDSPNILYYKEKNKPSHATVLGYLINHKELLNGRQLSKYVNTEGKDKGFLTEKRETIESTPVSSYSGDITPDANTIFVFGSNPEGRHGAGAAKVAREKFGAVYGQGEGLQGNAYALPTKDLRVKENNSLRSISEGQIIESIKKLYDTARQNPDKQFKVAYRNTTTASLNGYTGLEMIDMFLKAGSIPSNIVFSKEWVDTGKFTATDIPQVEVDLSSIRADKESPMAVLSREMSPAEIEDRASMIAHSFSEYITNYIRDRVNELEDEIASEEDVVRKLNLIKTLIDYKDPNKNRRLAIEELKIDPIIDAIKSDYSDIITYADEDLEYLGNPEHIRQSYQKIIDNFDTLFNLSLSELESIELIRLDRTTNTVADSKDIEDFEEQVNGDDEEGNRVNGNEGYTFRARFLDPGKSARAETKRALSNIIKVVNKYNPETGEYEIEDLKNDLGSATYYREDYIHNVLLSLLSGMDSPDDFSYIDKNGEVHFPILERHVNKYPWMSQVINKLIADPNLVTIFYNDFRKDFISYWIQDSEGKNIPINRPMVTESVLSNITRNYEQGNPQSPDSIFDSNMNLVKDNIDKALNMVGWLDRNMKTVDEDDIPGFIEKAYKVFEALGFNRDNISLEDMTTPEGFADNYEELRESLSYAGDILRKAQSLDSKEHLINNVNREIRFIAERLGKVTELDNKITFYQNGNTYPSYAAPNYIETTFKRILNDSKRERFLEENYKRYKWFYEDGEWNNEWLNLLENNEVIRKSFEIKNVFEMNGLDYEDWDKPTIIAGFIREYFGEYELGYKHEFGWYPFPIFSDTQMATFVKFKKYTVDFKSQLKPLYRKLVMQELKRIELVRKRAEQNIPKISNFDDRGKKFCFLPELNSLRVNYAERDMLFLDVMKILAADKNLSSMNEYIDAAIEQVLGERVAKIMTPDIISKVEDKIKETTRIPDVNNKLEEFVWNQVYASSQMVQIVTTDLAYYRDATDFQKRFKEVYAAGTKLNTNSKYGRKIEKTIYIKDSIKTSPSYLPLEKMLKKAMEEKRISKMDYDNITYKFKNINATDSQAYRSLSSYRAIMDMLGKWTDEMESAFNRITNNEWNISDLEVVWQTIKPFVFGHTATPDGLGDYIKTPHQNKNSEFLLLATYQVLSGIMNNSPQLRALNRFMEDYNIDVVQFESAVKVGGSGIININTSGESIKDALSGKITIDGIDYEMPDISGMDIDKAFDKIKEFYDNKLEKEQVTQDEYNRIIQYFTPSEDEVYSILENNVTKPTRDEEGNPRSTDIIERVDGQDYNTTTVHFLNYDDYMIAQPTPEHLFDAMAVYGSQFRNLISSDLPEDMEIKVGKDTIKGRANILRHYQSLIIENLLEDYSKLREETSTIEDLQKRLLSIVKGNPQYGRDLLNALELVDYNGKKVFNIPLDDPSITTKMQQLVNSMFKNGITRQHIKGEAGIVVSSFGFTDELQIVRNDDGSIKEVQCYLPAYSRDMFAPFLVEDEVSNGWKIDYNKMKGADKELLNIIGYRIPTEGKYSILPLTIKGFLPVQNGGSIMLPAEITTIAGLDFDIDKEFLMFPEFKEVKRYNIKGAWDDFYTDPANADIVEEIDRNIGIAFEDYQRKHPDDELDVDDYIEFAQDQGVKKYQFSETAQERFSKWFKSRKKDYYISTSFRKIQYDNSKSEQENSRAQRNNRIIDISKAILTHSSMAINTQSPGNFDKIKLASRRSEIKRNPEYLSKYASEKGITIITDAVAELYNDSLENLDSFLREVREDYNPLTIDTFAMFHDQNMTGGILIGIYANNTTMQGKLQNSGLEIAAPCRFSLNGRIISKLDSVYAKENAGTPNEINTLISLNCAQFSAASVDNVKDPNLATLMQNKQTANITCFMLRAGFSIQEIADFFDLPIVRGILTENDAKEMIADIEGGISTSEIHIKRPKRVNTFDMAKDTALFNYMDRLSDAEKEALLERLIGYGKLFNHIRGMAGYLGETVQAYRADSPNGALGHSIAIAKTQTLRVENIISDSTGEKYPILGVENIINNDIADPLDDIDSIRKALLSTRVPMLQAFYTLGIDFGTKLFKDYFIQSSDYVNSVINFINTNSWIPLKEGSIKAIYKAIITFGLTDSELFGDTKNASYEAKKAYYTKEFPSDFLKIVKDNPDIASIPFIRKLTVSDNKIVMENATRVSSRLKELLMASADMLLYMENPAAQQLAIHLFNYSFFAENMSFGHNKYNQYLSSIFKSSFPEYISTLRDMHSTIGTSRWDNFIDQFYSNNPRLGAYMPSSALEAVEDTYVTLTEGQGRNPKFKENIPFKYIYTIDKEDNIYLYKFDSERTKEGDGLFTYVPMPIVAGSNLYNINKSLEDMVNEYSKYEVEEHEDKGKKENKGSQVPLTNPYDEIDPSIIEKTLADNNMSEESSEYNSTDLEEFETFLADSLEDFNPAEALESMLEEYNPEEGFKEEGLNPCIKKSKK